MSGLFSTITSTIGQFFRNLLPSWVYPTSPELPEPSQEAGTDSDEGDDLDSFHFIKKGHNLNRPHNLLSQMSI